ncbi:MAG: hypothetical protein ACE5H7_11030 [Acidiferrobacterales bacterium]
MAATLRGLTDLAESELLHWVQESVKTSSNIFGHGYQGHVFLFEDAKGHRLIIKAPTGSMLTRFVHRTMLRNEHKAYIKLSGLRGTPHCYGLLDGTYLVLKYVDGLPVRRAEIRDQTLFFDTLLEVIKDLHKAGIAHGDLKKKDNLLVVDGRTPCIIDFGVAIIKKNGFAPLNHFLYNLGKKFDFNAWAKLKYDGRFENISKEDEHYYNRTVAEKASHWIKRQYLKIKKGLTSQKKKFWHY